MKYNININQKAIIDLNLDLDVVDMAIFDFIKDFSNSNNCTKVLINGKQYFWISHSKVINDLPIIRISTRQGILKRINKLIDAKLIDRADGDIQRSYYCFNENYDKVCFVTERQQPLSLPDNNSCQEPDNNRCHNYNTINNNTNDNKKVLFSNSNWNSYENLKLELSKDEDFKKQFAGVDLKNYIMECDTWSESKQEKRTNRGWLLTLRKWIRDSKKANKLVLLKNFENKKRDGHSNY